MNKPWLIDMGSALSTPNKLNSLRRLLLIRNRISSQHVGFCVQPSPPWPAAPAWATPPAFPVPVAPSPAAGSATAPGARGAGAPAPGRGQCPHCPLPAPWAAGGAPPPAGRSPKQGSSDTTLPRNSNSTRKYRQNHSCLAGSFALACIATQAEPERLEERWRSAPGPGRCSPRCNHPRRHRAGISFRWRLARLAAHLSPARRLVSFDRNSQDTATNHYLLQLEH